MGDDEGAWSWRRGVIVDGDVWVLAALAVGWFMQTGVRLAYSVMVPQIRTTFELSNAGAGFFFSVILFTLAAVQFPSGLVADRVGDRRVLIASVVATTLGVVLLAGAPIVAAFFVGCVLFGLGSGLFQPPSISILSTVFPDRTGTAHGVIFASGSVGTIVLPAVAGFLALRLGWRAGFGFAIPVYAVIVWGVWRALPKTAPTDDEDGRSLVGEVRGSVRTVLRQEILLVAAAMAIVAVAFNGLSAFLPTYFIEIKGLNQVTATTLFSVFFASAFLFQTAAGVFADRWGTRYILLIIPAICAGSVFGLTLVEGVFLLALFTVPLSSLSAFISVANTYYISVLPDDRQAGGLGLLRSVIIGLASLAPVIIGYLADLGQFTLSFQLIGASLVASAGVLLYSVVTLDGEDVVAEPT